MKYTLVVSIIFCLLSCHKYERRDLAAYTTPIENKVDSVCGVPVFGCIHGVRLLDNTQDTFGDTVIVKMFLKKLDYKMKTGIWYANSDQVVVIKFIKGFMTTGYVGEPVGEDSVKLNFLIKNWIE